MFYLGSMKSQVIPAAPLTAEVRPTSRFLRFGLASIATIVLGGIILVVAHATGLLVGDRTYWFQAAPWFLAPFAPVVGVTAAAYPRRWLSCRYNAFIVVALGAAVGGLFYSLSPGWLVLPRYLNFWRFIPWARNLLWYFSPDFEFQMASCWIAAGAAAMLVTLARKTLRNLAAATLLCLLAVVLPPPLFSYVTNNQELTVAFVVPVKPGASAVKTPRVIDLGPHPLLRAETNTVENHVLETLQKAGLIGPYRVAEIDRCGTGKKALQIVVLNAPVSTKAQLPEPNGTELIDIAEPNGWRTLPTQAATLGRFVEVRPSPSRSFLAMYWIHGATSTSGFGSAIRPD